MKTEVEEEKYDPCGLLRRTILRKLNFQRGLAVSSLAQLFDDDRAALRAAVAVRFSELANHVMRCDREELFSFQTALARWRLEAPLSMPCLDDLQKADYSHN